MPIGADRLLAAAAPRGSRQFRTFISEDGLALCDLTDPKSFDCPSAADDLSPERRCGYRVMDADAIAAGT